VNAETTTIERCERCGGHTVTTLLLLSSGHVGRVCSICRTCRRGRPYASKREYFQQAEPHAGKGLHNADSRR